MQYILTQHEYDALRKGQEKSIQLSEKKLQTLCTKIADEMPVKWGWGGPDPKPWNCKITLETKSDEEDEFSEEWYCDKCPVISICPSDNKGFSK